MLVAVTVFGCHAKETEEAPRPVEVQVTAVVAKDIPLFREWVGTTDGYVNAAIHPKVQGYLRSRNYKEGARVKEGDLLFTIDNRQYRAAYDQARGNLAQVEANLHKSNLDVQKYAPLVKEGAVSQQEFDNAVQTNRANQAAVEAAKAALAQSGLTVSWTQVRSPIAGVAGLAVTSVGDLVDTSTLLTTISQIDPIKVTFSITEAEYLYVMRHAIQAAKAQKEAQAKGKAPSKPDSDENFLTLTLSDGSVYDHKGKITVADRQIDPKTGTISLYGLFPNPDRLLRPGQFGKVKANVEMRKSVLLVPQKAILEVQDSTMVAVIDMHGRAEVRRVVCGETVDPGMRIVKEGLKVGENVVVEGLLKVRHGATVTATPAPSTPTPTAGN